MEPHGAGELHEAGGLLITAYLIGDRELVARLQAMPVKVQGSLLRAVTALSLQIQDYVKQSKLSGQVLKRRTHNLADNIHQRVEAGETAVTGIVGTNVPYAAFHEFGFSGTESVKGHLRTIKQAFGKPLKEGSKEIFVGAHSRQVNYPARSFLRTALADLTPQIKDVLDRAVREALQ